jgi:malate dehydrogenase (oxaloacetate-decarboxylating)
VKTESAYERALRYSRDFGGKVGMFPKVPITSLDDFAVWYTPGVAAVSRRVDENPDDSFTLTNRWNTAAIVSDGSRVLGLGRLRPEAALPVLEGKALLFKYLGGVDAIPLSIRAPDPDAFVRVVEALEPSFGAINLEDIESPKCFYILEELRRRLSIPVWHDDQLGTAGVVLAALYGALDVVGRRLGDVRITLLGAGAANIATARILREAGADLGKMRIVDSRGILHPEREDIDELLLKNRWKYELAIESNRDRVRGGVEEALRDADVLIAASRPGPGVGPVHGQGPHRLRPGQPRPGDHATGGVGGGGRGGGHGPLRLPQPGEQQPPLPLHVQGHPGCEGYGHHRRAGGGGGAGDLQLHPGDGPVQGQDRAHHDGVGGVSPGGRGGG